MDAEQIVAVLRAPEGGHGWCGDGCHLRHLHREDVQTILDLAGVTHMQRVITEYVNEVESGQKFDALVRLVPGLTSDDGMYGEGA